MLIYHYSHTTGEYLCTTEAHIDPLDKLPLIPAHATTTTPPEIPEGSIARWTGKWELVEDHRGEAVYSTTTADPVTISDLGALPGNVTPLVPPEYPLWDAEAKSWTTDMDALATAKRAERDIRIEAIRWRIERNQSEVRLDLTPTDDIVVLDAYIQELRDVPQQAGFPSVVEWPVVPE